MPSLTPAEFEHLLTTLPDPSEANEPAANISFLQTFMALGRERLGRLITEQSYAPGDLLFRESEPGDAMYIVLSGTIRLIKESAPAEGSADSPTTIGFLNRGDVVGEMSVLIGAI